MRAGKICNMTWEGVDLKRDRPRKANRPPKKLASKLSALHLEIG